MKQLKNGKMIDIFTKGTVSLVSWCNTLTASLLRGKTFLMSVLI